MGHHYVDVDYYSKLPVTGCRPSDVQSWVDRAGPVLAYRTIHLNDVVPASSPMIYLDMK